MHSFKNAFHLSEIFCLHFTFTETTLDIIILVAEVLYGVNVKIILQFLRTRIFLCIILYLTLVLLCIIQMRWKNAVVFSLQVEAGVTGILKRTDVH